MDEQLELAYTKLASGELSDEHRTALLLDCEVDPQRWRGLALAFVEHQQLSQRIVAADGVRGASSASLSAPLGVWQSPIIGGLCLVCLGILFGFGLASALGGKSIADQEQDERLVTEPDIEWSSDFAESKLVSLDSGKPMLAMFVSDFCQHCEFMKETVLPDPKVTSVLEDYVPVRMDVGQHAELAKSYDVQTLPTILLIRDGEVTTRRVGGFNDATAFAAFMRGALNFFEPPE